MDSDRQPSSTRAASPALLSAVPSANPAAGLPAPPVGESDDEPDSCRSAREAAPVPSLSDDLLGPLLGPLIALLAIALPLATVLADRRLPTDASSLPATWPVHLRDSYDCGAAAQAGRCSRNP